MDAIPLLRTVALSVWVTISLLDSNHSVGYAVIGVENDDRHQAKPMPVLLKPLRFV